MKAPVGPAASGADDVPIEPPFARFGRRAMQTFASLASMTVLTAVYGIIVARALGPQGKGVQSVLFLIPSIAALVLSNALVLANTYFGAKRPSVSGSLLANSLLFSMIGGVAASVVLAFAL